MTLCGSPAWLVISGASSNIKTLRKSCGTIQPRSSNGGNDELESEFRKTHSSHLSPTDGGTCVDKENLRYINRYPDDSNRLAAKAGGTLCDVGRTHNFHEGTLSPKKPMLKPSLKS